MNNKSLTLKKIVKLSIDKNWIHAFQYLKKKTIFGLCKNNAYLYVAYLLEICLFFTADLLSDFGQLT